MSSPGPAVTAVLLAGGASRRMGRSKPFLRIGGREVTAGLLDEASGVASDLLLSVADADPFRRALPRWGWESEADAGGAEAGGADAVFRKGGSKLRIIPDRREGLGPLAGVEACAAVAEGERCLLVAADLPFASEPLFRALLGELDRFPAPGPEEGTGSRPRIVLPVVDGRRQPLCSALDRAAGEIAARCLDEDRRSVAAWTDRLAVREVTAARLDRLMVESGRERAGPGSGPRGSDDGVANPVRQLFDLDTPADLRRARRWAASAREDDHGRPWR